MSTPSGAEAALVRAGLSLLERPAGSLIAGIKRWWRGKTILIVGQAGAGKTSFRDYLRHSILDDEKPTDKTYDIATTSGFRIQFGRAQSLLLDVKSARELPGQYGPVAHANLAFDYRPDAILIFSDLTAALTGQPEQAAGAWLETFCSRLVQKSDRDRRLKRLKSIILVVNKRDKVANAAAEKRTKQLQKILNNQLRGVIPTVGRPIPILPCISVSNPDGPKLIDRVIMRLAKDLAGET